MLEDQHDDHCWVNAGGDYWTICAVHPPFILLHRFDDSERRINCVLDMSHVNYMSYTDSALKLMAAQFPASSIAKSMNGRA